MTEETMSTNPNDKKTEFPFLLIAIVKTFWSGFGFAGVMLLFISIWMYVDTAQIKVFATDHDKFFFLIYILMAASLLLILVAWLNWEVVRGSWSLKESYCKRGTFYGFYGALLLFLSIWMYSDTASYLATDHNKFISIYILMAAGSLMTLFGFLECFGASMHRTLQAFLILIFVAEIAGAFYGYSCHDEVKSSITKRVPNMIKSEYSVQDAVTLAVDQMQQKFNCCGVTGISDWANSSFNNKNKETTTKNNITSLLDKLITTAAFKVPRSCCIKKKSRRCDNATNIIDVNTTSTALYSEGCLNKIEDKVEDHLSGVFCVVIFIFAVQMLHFVSDLVFYCRNLHGPKSSDPDPAQPV